MIRHVKILEFGLASLWRRKYRNISLVVVYTFIVAILGSVLLLAGSMKREALHLLADAPEIIVQKTSAGRHDLIPTNLIIPILRIPGVAGAEARYWGYYYDALANANYTMLGAGSGLSGRLELLDGALPSAPGQLAIGSGVAEVRAAKIGGDLILIDSGNTGVVFDVVGMFRTESNLLTNDLIVMTRDDLTRFFGLPQGKATDIAVSVYNTKEVPTIAAKIKQAYPAARPITRSEIIRTYEAVFSWRSGMLLVIFSSALVAFGILAWDKATGISAEEKREIGILKAIGWDTGDVLELKFWEGMIISSSSFLLGMILAVVHVMFFDASILMPVIKGWSILYPDFRIVPRIDPYQVFTLSCLTIVPYVACTIVPSWKASIADPEEIMRT